MVADKFLSSIAVKLISASGACDLNMAADGEYLIRQPVEEYIGNLDACLRSAVRELLEHQGEKSDDEAVEDWISIYYDAEYEQANQFAHIGR